MPITLEDVKAEQKKIAAMIDSIEIALKQPCFFEFNGVRIPLAQGERYVGTIISADGSKNHHLIMLPGELDAASWSKAMEWAKIIGGDLPDRIEQALLFATMKDQFNESAYWSNTQHASNSYNAWYQYFNNGTQNFSFKSSELRARAFRRLEIQ